MPQILTRKLISGHANLSLGRGIAQRRSLHQGAEINLVTAGIERFNDQEIFKPRLAVAAVWTSRGQTDGGVAVGVTP